LIGISAVISGNYKVHCSYLWLDNSRKSQFLTNHTIKQFFNSTMTGLKWEFSAALV